MLTWIWLGIGLIFYYFSFVFLQYSRTPIRSFLIREGQKTAFESATDLSEQSSFNQLWKDFDRYLDSVNSKNISRAKIAAFGFFLAGLASFIAAYIS
ncbi:MAG: hypothetical protein ACXAB7_21985 [Candidatus Kariarchaeaceae archaeon]|jgi:hypothetical protein